MINVITDSAAGAGIIDNLVEKIRRVL